MHLRRVQIATCLKDHQQYAVKIIKKADSKEGLLLQLQSEHMLNQIEAATMPKRHTQHTPKYSRRLLLFFEF
jgi:hypothetical protein